MSQQASITKTIIEICSFDIFLNSYWEWQIYCLLDKIVAHAYGLPTFINTKYEGENMLQKYIKFA